MAEDMFRCDEPFALFGEWFAEAETSEQNDANAAALATATPGGRPSVRMVLIKRVDARGFCFYTNAESCKGVELAANPHAALCMHWKSLRRQVRAEGAVLPLDDADADHYFHSRSHRSQAGAAVSLQSRPLKSRAVLEDAVKNIEARYPEAIPRPAYWRGYCIVPDRIEFWRDGADRLHDRLLFLKSGSGWSRERLYP